MTDLNLGEFEQLVLLALLQLGDNAYGVTIREEIAGRTGRDVSLGAVYKTLERLEAKALVRSRIGDPTPERGGRRKKFYAINGPGVRALRQSYRAMLSMAAGIKGL